MEAILRDVLSGCGIIAFITLILAWIAVPKSNAWRDVNDSHRKRYAALIVCMLSLLLGALTGMGYAVMTVGLPWWGTVMGWGVAAVSAFLLVFFNYLRRQIPAD